MSQTEPILGSLRLPIALLVFCVLMTACAPQDPVERVTEIRGQYRIKLNTFNTWLPQGFDGGADEEGADLEGVAEAGSEEEAVSNLETGDEILQVDESGDGLIDDAMPAATDILFDLVVYFEGKESLPGVTIDIVHADPFKKEKLVFKQWIDTKGMFKNETRQVSFTRSIEDFIEGDQFSVVLRSTIPSAELGDYREYQ